MIASDLVRGRAAAREPVTARAARPRVLQVVISLDPGGTERLVIELVTRLRQEADALVCCLDGPGRWAGELEDRGIAVRALFRRPGFRPWLGVRIARLARDHGATVIHCHHYSPFVYGRLAAFLRPGARVIFTEHGRHSDAPASRKRRIANSVLGRLPAEVYAVSHELRRYMIDGGFPPRRVGVIHNGIDAGAPPAPEERRAAREALGFGPDAFVVGTVARLDPVKDIETLVAAFATFRREHRASALAIVGDGPDRARLEAAARASGAGQAVRFLGHLDGARRLLPGLDAYVNSSTSEGISLTILEAMAASLPVVATAVGGTPEIVADGECGVLVPPRDPAAVSAALARIATDRSRARALGAAARRRVEERFTIDRMVRRYLAAYRGARPPAEDG